MLVVVYGYRTTSITWTIPIHTQTATTKPTLTQQNTRLQHTHGKNQRTISSMTLTFIQYSVAYATSLSTYTCPLHALTLHATRRDAMHTYIHKYIHTPLERMIHTILPSHARTHISTHHPSYTSPLTHSLAPSYRSVPIYLHIHTHVAGPLRTPR